MTATSSADDLVAATIEYERGVRLAVIDQPDVQIAALLAFRVSMEAVARHFPDSPADALSSEWDDQRFELFVKLMRALRDATSNDRRARAVRQAAETLDRQDIKRNSRRIEHTARHLGMPDTWFAPANELARLHTRLQLRDRARPAPGAIAAWFTPEAHGTTAQHLARTMLDAARHA